MGATSGLYLPDGPFPRIPPEWLPLWRKVETHEFDDDPTAPYLFRDRVRERNKWKKPLTERAVVEYLKYVLLSQMMGHSVTPSKIVDEVWHVHMLYTDNYWIELCLKKLGRPLHHYPGNGSNNDNELNAARYQRTLFDYTRVFGTPPHDIWGCIDPSIDWRTIMLKFPMTARVKTGLMDMFARPWDEAKL